MVLGWTLGAQDCLTNIVLLYQLHFHPHIACLKPFILLGLKTKKFTQDRTSIVLFFLTPDQEWMRMKQIWMGLESIISLDEKKLDVIKIQNKCG